MRALAILATLCLLVVGVFKGMHTAQAQKPSPAAKASCDLGGGKSLTVDYSSPRRRAAKFSAAWCPTARCGAPEPMKPPPASPRRRLVGTSRSRGQLHDFHSAQQGQVVAGHQQENRRMGHGLPGQPKDLARVDMKASALPSAVENFTISFEKAGSGANLNIDWDTTRASIPIAKK